MVVKVGKWGNISEKMKDRFMELLKAWHHTKNKI